MLNNNAPEGYSTLEDSMFERIQRDEEGYKNSKYFVRNQLYFGLMCVAVIILTAVVILITIIWFFKLGFKFKNVCIGVFL